MASGPSGIMTAEGVLSFRAVLWRPVLKDWKKERWQASFYSPCGCSHLSSPPHEAVGFVICVSVGSSTAISGLPGKCSCASGELMGL